MQPSGEDTPPGLRPSGQSGEGGGGRGKARLIVPIVVAVAACDHWNRTTYSQMALDMMVAAVVLQIGYVLGVLGQIVFRHLLPDQASSSSEKH